jgi:hypothetical protein
LRLPNFEQHLKDNKMKRFALLLCMALIGCAASYHREQLTGITASTLALSPESVVYVVQPADGAYEEKVYSRSGQMTEQAIAAAFAKHGSHVIRADTVESKPQAIASARASGAQYAAIATIIQWEPRATEWSGLPSRISVNMAIIDVKTGKTSSEEALSARSRIVSWTRTSPESLLHDSIGGYVDALYRTAPVVMTD